MVLGRPIAKIPDFVTGAVAFVTVAVIAFFYIDKTFGLMSGDALASLTRTKDGLLFATLGLAGLEFALRRNFIVFGLFVVLAALAGVFFFVSGGL
jgi:hypothetical protein